MVNIYNNSKKVNFLHCTEEYQFSCEEDNWTCFDISDMCKYKLNGYGMLIPCLTGAHLGQCKDYECNIMHKCPGYYCILWNYVCDSFWDCPNGNDELSSGCLQYRMCLNMFKCERYHICIHVAQVCDEIPDCPSGDDELLCAVQSIECPAGCVCLALAASCVNVPITLNTMRQCLFFQSLVLQNSRLKFAQDTLLTTETHFESFMTKLTIHNSNLSNICQMMKNKISLQFVDVNNNIVSYLDSSCFTLVKSIVVIILSDNMISSVTSNLFQNLTNLKYLNLSHNPIIEIKNAFTHVPKLSLLFMFWNLKTDDQTVEVTSSFLDDVISLKCLQPNFHHLCCTLPAGAKCTAVLPWYISCSSLLLNSGLKITFYCVSLSVFLANIVSILLQAFLYHHKILKTGVFGILVGTVNIADILCSVPLFVLWITDLVLKGNVVAKEIVWRSSVFCFLVFALQTQFSVPSPASLCLLSYQRLELVEHPIDTKYKNTEFIVKKAVLLFGLSVMFSVTTTVITWLNIHLVSSSIPTAFCSPYVDPTGNIPTVTVITGLCILWQMISVVFIIVVYVKLILGLKNSKQNAPASSQQHHMSSLQFKLSLYLYPTYFVGYPVLQCTLSPCF